MTHKKATFGIYRSKEDVSSGVALLARGGFGEARATVLFPDHNGDQDFPNVQKNEVFKYARVGSVIGAFLFLIFVFFAMSGLISFISLGDLPMWKRVLAATASLFAGGVVGAACGALVGIGTPNKAARRYGQYVEAGGILLSVQTENPDEQKRVEKLLEESGAEDIRSIDEEAGWSDVRAETNLLSKLNFSSQPGQNSRPFSTFEDSGVQK